MPTRAPTICTQPGCSRLAYQGARCPAHQHLTHRPSAAAQGYGKSWRRIRLEFLTANPYCEQCGAPALDADHRVSKRAGGTDDWANLQALCHPCHSRKTAASDGGFGNVKR